MKQDLKRCILFASLFLLLPGNAVAQQPKLKTIAVGDFKYMGDAAYVTDFAAFNEMLRTSFTQSRRFSLVERAKLDQMLKEQNLGEAGIVSPETAKQMGTAVAADFVIYGSISEAVFTDRVRGQIKEFRISVDLSILDVASGEIKAASDLEVTDFGSVKQVMRTLSEALTSKVIFNIYPIMVASASPTEVMMNYGEQFVSVGQVYQVFAKGNVVMDPATGEVLAFEEIPAGTVRVTQATGKFSKAEILDSSQPIAAGMICRPASGAVAATNADAGAGAGGNIPGTGMVVGVKPTLFIGKFKYSNEFDLSQTADRGGKRISSAGAGQGSGGVLGAVVGGLITGGKPSEWLGGAAVGALVGQTADSERNRHNAADPQGAQLPSDQVETAIDKESQVLREMVVTKAHKSGKFTVVEQTRKGEIKEQMDNEVDGDYSTASLVQRGKMQSAKYSAFGTITRFETDTKQKGYSIVGGNENVTMTLTLELRVVDNELGTIVCSDQITGSVQTQSSQIGLLGFGTASENQGAMGGLLDTLSQNIISKVVSTLWPIKIIAVNAGENVVTINVGEALVSVGDLLAVYAQGAKIVDPDTGEILGSEEKTVGSVQVYETTARFSKCKISTPTLGTPTMIIGQICRPAVRGVATYNAAPSEVSGGARNAPSSSSRPSF